MLGRSRFLLPPSLLLILLLQSTVNASLGDRLPEFKECLDICVEQNCNNPNLHIPLHRRLLLWNCNSECDYTCQHIVTNHRLSDSNPQHPPIVQFHGKWPFHRFMGMQEPFSVIFSLFNFLAHDWGMSKLRSAIPEDYPLRKYYILFGYFGLASWTFSMIFHIRDFAVTEKLDYFAAGASVLYGFYHCAIRVFRLDHKTPQKQSVLRAWTLLCILLYLAHLTYLSLWSWDYTYNMAANVVIGIMTNILWSVFSFHRYQKLRRTWAAWPGMIVAWIVLAMSLELFDFPPIGGMLDAHSLWHLGTVIPTIWWYNFLVKDVAQDIQGSRLKA